MAECAVCGTEVRVSEGCPHCARPVCAAHRAPESHDCSGVQIGGRAWHIDLDAGAAPPREDGDPLRDLLSPGWKLAALTLLLVVGAVVVAAMVAPDDSLDPERAERLIAAEVNAARSEAGVGTLKTDAELAALADAHSADMRERGYVDHVTPDGEGLAERYAAAGIDCYGGENIYASPRGGVTTSERALAEFVVESWLDSPGHRETLLKERFTRQGLGVAVGADGALYVTQDLC
jgi:hypothetical protein